MSVSSFKSGFTSINMSFKTRLQSFHSVIIPLLDSDCCLVDDVEQSVCILVTTIPDYESDQNLQALGVLCMYMHLWHLNNTSLIWHYRGYYNLHVDSELHLFKEPWLKSPSIIWRCVRSISEEFCDHYKFGTRVNWISEQNVALWTESCGSNLRLWNWTLC